MGNVRPPDPRRRLIFDASGIDWSDDGSIDRWAQYVWQQATDEWGKDMNETPSTVLTDNYTEAIAYAARKHGQQPRKGNEIPYMAHLLGVSSLVLEAGGTETEAIAALLHDAVEDQGGMATHAEIAEQFGSRVAEIVLACSDSTDAETKATQDYLERKHLYLMHLEASTDERSVMVSIADKVHNARAIVTDLQVHGYGVLTKFNGTPGEILYYYVECLRIGRLKNVPDELLWPLDNAVRVIAEYVLRGA